MKIGLQLWSVRDALAQDFAGTIARVAQLGFDGVELFGDHRPAAETRAALDQAGLEVAGHHFALPQLEPAVDACIERTLTVGAPVLVCAWSQATPDRGWPQIADALERIAQACNARGLRFAYHNHGHELLETVEGTPAFDVIAAKPNVLLEPDIAWLHAGKADPVAYLERYAQKIALVHVKDVAAKGADWATVDLGTGGVNLSAALEAAKRTASPWLIIEQDESADPWRSAAHNIEWLKARA